MFLTRSEVTGPHFGSEHQKDRIDQQPRQKQQQVDALIKKMGSESATDERRWSLRRAERRY